MTDFALSNQGLATIKTRVIVCVLEIVLIEVSSIAVTTSITSWFLAHLVTSRFLANLTKGALKRRFRSWRRFSRQFNDSSS